MSAATTTKTTRALSRRALRAMTNEQLTELLAVNRKTLRIHKENAMGHPGYNQIKMVKRERYQAKYEIDAINKILIRRQLAALEAGLDRDATAIAVAA